MIRSMTGYAAASADSPRGTLSIELRSVNSRFLDLSIRVGEELRALEPMLRELLTARVSRGKVECRLYLGAGRAAAAAQSLDPAAMERLRELAAQVKRAFPDAAALRAADVLRWPGVLAEPPADEERTRQAAEALARKAIGELVATREREGAKLGAAIGEHVAAMRLRVEQVAPLIPHALSLYQQKITEKLREAIGSADDDRVRTELALFAARIDVDEELTRLRAHFSEVERVLKEAGARSTPVGKRLDFIAQELNREANTLASKALGQQVSDCALELKLLVEQMREQVQNLE